MLIIGIILFIIGIFLLCFTANKLNKIHKINNSIDRENEELLKKNSILKKEKESLEIENTYLEKDYKQIFEKIELAKKTIDEELENRQKNAEKEFQNSSNKLKEKLDEEKKDWEISSELLVKSYSELQKKELMELDKIRATRAAAQKALTREKEIKEQKKFYCLPCSTLDKNDIQILERVKKDLNNPRILSMLIWSTYFQKPMNILCNNVLGTDIVCGIYKITNQITNECYIGQSVDIAKRFKDHAKHGLGIDAPLGNKLYKAMQKDGIWNFSFELLEKCPREQLNEKEYYYIQLYMSNDFGYNTLKGNTK